MEPPSADDKPHLPSPSLWPVGFAVGIACLLVGSPMVLIAVLLLLVSGGQ